LQPASVERRPAVWRKSISQQCVYDTAFGQFLEGQKEGIYVSGANITWAWNANICKYQTMSREEMLSYLWGRHVHLIGDSNLRFMYQRLIFYVTGVSIIAPKMEDSKEVYVEGERSITMEFYWSPSMTWTLPRLEKLVPKRRDLFIFNNNLHDCRPDSKPNFYRSRLHLLSSICDKWVVEKEKNTTETEEQEEDPKMEPIAFWMSPVKVIEANHKKGKAAAAGWLANSQMYWDIVQREGMLAPLGHFRPLDVSQMLTYAPEQAYRCCYENGKRHAIHLDDQVYDIVWQFFFNSLKHSPFSSGSVLANKKTL